jgi:hypothetical protein
VALATALVWSGCREGSAPSASQSESPAQGEQVEGKANGSKDAGSKDSKHAAEAGERDRSTPARQATIQPVTLPVGTALKGELETTVATDKNQVGDPVRFRTSEPITANGRTVVAAGARVLGTVTYVRAAGRMKGAAELTIRFTELELASGQRFPITCEPLRQVVKGDGKETAAEIGGGAAAGGILGGALGGKGGALKGVAIGAAVGTGVAAGTKGNQIVLPAGKSISVRLSAPTTLTNDTAS